MDFNAGNNEGEKYEMEAIRDSAVYVKKSANYLSKLYYLVSKKGYLEKENI